MVCALIPAVAAAQQADLAKARALYNERQFDSAITAALTARSIPAIADSAAIVAARAHLERYRERADPADLGAAREALGSVRAGGLVGRDRAEYLLALGESLFLEDDFGPAAETFETALESASYAPELYNALLEWWASALERQTAAMPRAARRDAFQRVRQRMTSEIAHDPSSATASYWLVVALRGSDEPVRAWDAAVAGWARARLMGDGAAAFRADLDKLVMDGIIPDRLRTLAPEERGTAESQVRTDWNLVKEKWN
jgi:hypothetical protein